MRASRPLAYNGTMHRICLTLLLFNFVVLPAAATTVYKTVDANGVVSFSDQPPTSGSEAEILELSITYREPSALDRKRLDAMRETTDRMAADRREREKLRLLAKQTQASYQPQQFVAYYPQQSLYSGYGYRRQHGGYYRPRPEHPIAKPLYRWQGLNDYPASLVRSKYSPRVRASFMNDPVSYRAAGHR